MKKRIGILICLQLVVLLYIGVNVFGQKTYIKLLLNEHSTISLGVSNNEEYNLFLDILSKTNTAVIRKYEPEPNTVVIYTNDITLNNNVNLIEGLIPNQGEFISNIYTGQSNQSGTFRDIIPKYTFFIYNLETADSFNTNSLYQLKTIDLTLINYIIDYLNGNVYNIRLIDVTDNLGYLHAIISIFTSINQIILVAILNLFLFLSIIISIFQYFNNKLKKDNILLNCGYSKFKISKILVLKFLNYKLLLLVLPISYIFYITYLFLQGYYSYFYYQLSILFIAIVSILAITYLVVTFIFIYLFLTIGNYKNINKLESKKIYFLIYFLNLGFKSVFTVFFIISVVIFIDTFSQLSSRKSTLHHWDIARGIHKTIVYNIGQFEDLELEELVTQNVKKFYEHLLHNGTGFIIDSNNFRSMEFWGIEEVYPMIHPEYRMLTHLIIDSNYLKFNPIFSIDGMTAVDKIIYDDNTMNILVPYKMSYMEKDILLFYLDYFYFHKAEIDNMYNHDLGRELNEILQKELNINIIYVKDNQYYFTFDPEVRVSTGNIITDPIVVVYTGNVHHSYLHALSVNGLFFYSNNTIPSEYITSIIGRNDILSATNSLYDQKHNIISILNQEYYIALFLIIGIVFMSLAISYNLFWNYYQKNSFIIVKDKKGYSVFKRKKYFIMVYFANQITAIIILSFIFNISLLLIGMLLVIIDILFLLIISKKFLQSVESFKDI